jgi:hypothetical protein
LALTVGSRFSLLRAQSGFLPLSLRLCFFVGDPTISLLRASLGRFTQRLRALALTGGRAQACAMLL